MKTRQEIKKLAQNQFVSNYWMCVGAFVVYYLAFTAISFITMGIGTLLLLPPLTVGLSYFSLSIYRGKPSSIEGIFTEGFSNYGRKLGGILWMELFIFLWSLLFVIPGIIKAIAYSLTPYILADCPEVTATEALKLSMRMTQGYKGDIFVMYLSFFGWQFLNGFTAGILGVFFVNPYMNLSIAGLYDELKTKALSTGIVKHTELI